jgi:broad specificity phosphatase PhoE
MEAVLGMLEQTPVDAVATSPLRRCAAFARAWAQARGLSPALLDGFRERAFGAWEGLSGEEAAARDTEAYRRYQASAGVAAPPGGEDVEALRLRVRSAWEDWLANAAGGHRLLVTHAGVMRALLMDLLGLPAAHAWRVALPEAAHFQVSVLAGHPPVLLNLNPWTA